MAKRKDKRKRKDRPRSRTRTEARKRAREKRQLAKRKVEITKDPQLLALLEALNTKCREVAARGRLSMHHIEHIVDEFEVWETESDSKFSEVELTDEMFQDELHALSARLTAKLREKTPELSPETEADVSEVLEAITDYKGAGDKVLQERKRDSERTRKGSVRRAYTEASLGSLIEKINEDDPYIQLWMRVFTRQVGEIVMRGNVTKEDAYAVVRIIDDWEKRGPAQFKSEKLAASAITGMLREVATRMSVIYKAEGRDETEESAADLSDIVECILGYKTNAMRSVRRSQLPEGQGAVATYLQCTKALLEATSDEHGPVRDLSDKGRDQGLRMARRVWTQLRNARVFEFPLSTWKGLYSVAEKTLATWYDEKSDAIFDEEVGIIDRLRGIGRELKFPEKLPFEHTYIGVGGGFLLNEEMGKLRIWDDPIRSRQRFVGADLLGYLISEPDQQVYEMVHVIMEDDDYILPLAQYYNGEWPLAETLAPWLVHGLVNLINEHNTVVISQKPGLAMKRDFKKVTKGARAQGFLPKPYYLLRMKKDVVDEADLEPKVEGPGRTLSRRYDRRGHERCKVIRGLAPISDKDEAKLLKRNYRFINGRPGGEDAERLAYRQMPPKAFDEWMAIKVTWIEHKICGHPDLPYVPAVRVPARKAS